MTKTFMEAVEGKAFSLVGAFLPQHKSKGQVISIHEVEALIQGPDSPYVILTRKEFELVFCPKTSRAHRFRNLWVKSNDNRIGEQQCIDCGIKVSYDKGEEKIIREAELSTEDIEG